VKYYQHTNKPIVTIFNIHAHLISSQKDFLLNAFHGHISVGYDFELHT